MRLTENNVQWIKAPVWKTCDNCDENTAKRLPPTKRFKGLACWLKLVNALTVIDPPSTLTDRVFACCEANG